MNLKLVAVSMSVLGLISSPVFADTMHKHKHHKKHHHMVHDYKASGALSMQAAMEPVGPMVVAPATSVILDQMNQATTMNKPMPEWFNRVGISGGVNLDGGKWGSRSVTNQAFANAVNLPVSASSYPAINKAGYTGENTKRFSINNAYLNVTADVNEWTKALAVVSYMDSSVWYNQAYTSYLNNSAANLGNLNQNLTLEQAVVHFGNFECTPFFVEVGKQFLDYGRYKIHPITASMDQTLTETLRNAVKVGFINDMGLHGSVFTFQDGIYKHNDAQTRESSMNYGAALGYASINDHFGYDVGAGYMYNMVGANDVSALLASNTSYVGFHNHVDAIAAYADLNYDAFTLGARYTQATKRFSSLDLPRSLNHLTTGAKPWAAGVVASYDFDNWRKQNVYLGYQASHDTVYLNLPHSRYLVGYSIDVLKNTKLSAEWDHDNAWNGSQGGPSGGNSNLVSVRAAVKFG